MTGTRRGMFFRSGVNAPLGPMGSFGLDNSGELLSDAERNAVKADCECARKHALGLDVEDRAVNESCVNGFRVLRRANGDNSPTAAEQCTSNSTPKGGGTQVDPKQLANLFGAIGGALNQAFNPPPPPPPKPETTIIPHVPDFVTIGAGALVMLLVVWHFAKG